MAKTPTTLNARKAAATPRAAGDTSPQHVPDTRAGLELEHFLPYRLSVLSNRISGAIADTYAARFGIGVTEWRVVAVLGRYPGLSANEVAQRTAMDKVAVSRAVAALIDKQLLERRMDATDRRRSMLALSRTGKRLHARIAPMALEIESELLSGFSREERQRLLALLDRLQAGLDGLTPWL